MGRKHVVAVVDDDVSFREALTGLIRAFGFEVVAFGSARTYLEVVESLNAGCLVLDIYMPEMTGLHLQRRLSATGFRTPIIFVTSSLDEETHARALNDGALAVLEKPCSPQALLMHLKIALKILD
jgi:FixJ family two-component response regulator